jgi:hypothetical protein
MQTDSIDVSTPRLDRATGMNARLPSHIEAKALLRLAQARGGFGMLLHRGDLEQGAILLVLRTNAGESRVCERLPQITGSADWALVNPKNIQTDQDLNEYLIRRVAQDPDLWTIELTVPEVERFVSDMSS